MRCMNMLAELATRPPPRWNGLEAPTHLAHPTRWTCFGSTLVQETLLSSVMLAACMCCSACSCSCRCVGSPCCQAVVARLLVRAPSLLPAAPIAWPAARAPGRRTSVAASAPVGRVSLGLAAFRRCAGLGGDNGVHSWSRRDRTQAPNRKEWDRKVDHNIPTPLVGRLLPFLVAAMWQAQQGRQPRSTRSVLLCTPVMVLP